MAFDQTTRGRLQKLVNACRTLLSDEFSVQLQQTYGLDPNTGDVTPMARLTHLDDRQRHTAEVLRQTMVHYLGTESDTQDHRIAVMDRMVREQAFTVLNRMAALLMIEARGQLFESVSKGYQSRGYQLYAKIAGTTLGDSSQSYQAYLFSVFDELAQELPALFDRYASNGLLFPRETILRSLLAELNHFEIEPLWAEDETIGWIYQYFNSKEERKAMRDASQAPRNSRELAVRNQFFTPRFVVEFLVDNTLGRLWFNETGGQTDLRDSCKHLLVKPDEQPQAAIKLRDPRTIKLLDPACGSMHFGLYAFDLFLEIYREAWLWEQQHGPGSLDVSVHSQSGFKPLSQTYTDQEAFLQDAPRLIIENNIYGVDIDPRAAQIASLALWLRAQRTWYEAGVKDNERPKIGRGNVVAAIAPPAEKELRIEFAATLDKRDSELFEKTLNLLKGIPELGVLLQVERELPRLIRLAYVGTGNGLFSEQEREVWLDAEARLRSALTEFAVRTKATFQGQLFVQDALECLRLIDLSRDKFDVIVMNPPFGDSSPTASQYLKETYDLGRPDLYMCFFLRCAQDLLAPNGFQGQITSKTFHTLEFFEPMRRELLTGDAKIQILADLGSGVLDGATVDTSAYIVTKTPISSFYSFDLSTEQSKDTAMTAILGALRSGASPDYTWTRDHSWFLGIPNGSLCYWLPTATEKAIKSLPQFDSAFACKPLVNTVGATTRYGKVRQGLIPGDIFRFTRLRWEVSAVAIGKNHKWVPMMKGGDFRRYYSNEDWLFLWANNGCEPKAFAEQRYGGASRTIKNESEFFKPGITFPRVSSVGLNARLMPEDAVFSDTGMAVIPEDKEATWNLLGLFNSRLADMICAALHPGRKFEVAHIAAMPMAESVLTDENLRQFTREAFNLVRSVTEEEAIFDKLIELIAEKRSLKKGLVSAVQAASDCWVKVADRQRLIDSRIFEIYSIPLEEQLFLSKYIDRLRGAVESGPEIESVLRPEKYRSAIHNSEEVSNRYVVILIDRLVGVAFSRLGEAGGSADIADDLLSIVSKCSEDILSIAEGGLVQEFEQIISGRTLAEYFTDTKQFFADHLLSHTLSPRKAPIYWPLSTASGSYTLWIYYPRLSKQTLYSAVNDFVEPRIKQIESEIAFLRNKGAAMSQDQAKQYETLQTLKQELTDQRDTLLKIAPAYQPNHDDGVQITAAPLWPLFRSKPWQKILKDTWAKLEKGDYDWAHLAMAYWPDRVREKCKSDKSIAIAHALEALYVEPDAKPKKAKKIKA
jgi:hypothetical protein